MRFEKITYPGKEKVTLDCFLHDSGLRLGQDLKRPAVVICPGGGYFYLSPREGDPVAMAYSAKGFQTFILSYSLREDVAGFAPLQELDWAIGLIREHAEDWLVDETKIAVCGFSAGEHLALAGGLLGKNRPNAMVLGYPAVSIRIPGSDFMLQMLSGKDQPLETDAPWVDLTKQVTPDAPPLFVFTTGDDALTRDGTMELVRAYHENGRTCEYHLFQKGPHGYSLANAAAADGSSQVLNPQVEKWHELSVQWLFETFGELKFEDRSTSRLKDMFEKEGLGSIKGAEHA